MIPFVLVGIWIVASIPTRIYVRSHGTPIQVTIDAKHLRKSSKSNRITQYLEYHYIFAGKLHNDQQAVTNQDYQHITIGQKIPARAMTIAGSTMCVTDLHDLKSTSGAIVFSMMWNSFIALFLCVLLVPAARQRWLVRNGTATSGTLLKDRQTLLKGSSSNFFLTFTFTTSDGQQITKEFQVSRKMYETAAVGTPVTALYDPARPQRAVAYEYGAYEVRPMVE